MSVRIKVYELAKEFNVDPQRLVEQVRRLGIDVKSQMSILGTEEIRLVREYFRGLGKTGSTSAPAGGAPVPAGKSVVEQRVGATVIRRRAKPKTTETAEDAPEESFTEEPEKIEPEKSIEVHENPEPAPPQKRGLVPPSRIVKTSKMETPASPKMEHPRPIVKEIKVADMIADEEPKKRRRLVGSLIKRTTTDEHLANKIGPKPTIIKKREVRPAAAGAGTAEADRPKGPKRFKEIAVAPAPAVEAAKETTKRRMLSRQSTVFKKSDYLKREIATGPRKKKGISRPALKTQITTPAAHKRVVEMGEAISVSELAQLMSLKAKNVIEKLFGMGLTVTINDKVDFDTATLVATEFGFEVKVKNRSEEEILSVSGEDASANIKSRPPVVTVMGHVDHGKTSLLDRIREANVVAKESGGITQHIGAYTVKLKQGKIAFVDTPGHEAFTAMRARGAKVTDLVVLVVAATEGVMPQTIESINHAKAASVPIIVALNKCDLPDAQPDRVKQALTAHDLTPEEWGGETIFVNVSAKTGTGVDKLLESILLQSEMLELKADYGTPARGTIIEARLDKSRGPVVTVLVQAGELHQGDTISCGQAYGNVRSMTDSFGARVEKAGPSDPVEVLGLSKVPNVGDELRAVKDEATAREVAELRENQDRDKAVTVKKKLTLEEMLAATEDQIKELRVILKADVQGSSEAIREALSKLPSDKVVVKVLHMGTGGITESDVMLATASEATIIGFNVRPDIKAKRLAETEGVGIYCYSIIYELIDRVKNLLEGMLDKNEIEKVIGRAQVRDVFDIPKVGKVAGSAVIDGKVTRSCFLRLLRNSTVVYEGKIGSLRRFKEDVKEVATGYECGISIENFNDIKAGDELEAFIKEKVQATL